MSDEENSITFEKESKLILHKDSEGRCSEEQSIQKQVVGTECSNRCFCDDNNYDGDDDKSCSSYHLLTSKYGMNAMNQLFEKHDRSNSDRSIQSVNSNTESSEDLLIIKDINTDYTSRTSSTNSVEQIELTRTEDKMVKKIKSIDENREVRWPVKRKIDKNLYKRHLNARVRRLVSPKSALVVFSELYRGVPIQIEFHTFLNSTIYTAMIEMDGQMYVANSISKTEAKQKACENLFRNMLAKKISEPSIDIKMDDGENGTPQKPIGPPEEDFPWSHFASLAMYKLLNHWQIRPASKDINLQDEQPLAIKLPPKVAAPMKMFPEDPSKYHPVQLINQMKPGTEFIATRCLNFPSFFQVSCVIDGVLFTGQHLSKKAAKNEACIAAINYFWNFNFNNILF